MKRVLFSLLAMFAVGSLWAIDVTDISKYENVIYNDEVTVVAGTEAILPISLKNDYGLTAFEFTLVLPTGVEFLGTAGLNSERLLDDDNKIFKSGDAVDGVVTLFAAVIEDHGFIPGNGVVCNVKIKIPETMTPGEYEVRYKNVSLSGRRKIEDIDGTTVTNKLDDIFISEDIVSKIIVTDRLTLDENATEVPDAAENVNVKVIRTINANEWSTICLPFAMTAEQVATAFPETTVELADFTGAETKNNNITVKFASVNPVAIEANHPYIIKVSKDVSEFEVDGVNIDPKDAVINKGTSRKPNEFIGTYIANTVLGVAKDDENKIPMLFISGGKFYASWGTAKMKAFRAYFNIFDLYDVLSTDADAKLGFFVDDETTAIDGINTGQRVVEGVYDLQGRKVMVKDGDINNLQRGIYIINGKKVAIK